MLHYAVSLYVFTKFPIYLSSQVSYIDVDYIEISLVNTTAHLQVPLVPKLNQINDYE